MPMSVYTTIARPYAKAVFEYAVEKNAVAEWGMFLQKAGLVVRDKRIQLLLQNPHIDMNARLNILRDLCRGSENDANANNSGNAQNNLLAVLAKFNRLLVIPDLAGLFNELVKQFHNTVDVTVTSAFNFSAEQQKQLQKALEIRLGKQVTIEIVEDKNLIGGAIIRAGDFVIDGSVLGKLKRLRKAVNV